MSTTEKPKFITEDHLDHALRALKVDLRDNINQIDRRVTAVVDRRMRGRLMGSALVFGFSGAGIAYAATQSDGWTSQVEALAWSAAAGIASAVVSAIWMAIFQGRDD